MHIEHIGIWTRQLDIQKTFYEIFFSLHGSQREYGKQNQEQEDARTN